jgi:branched-chain amino acid transport system ATP-binding protein
MGVSIELEEGETVSVIGANGAGKSTLMKSIMGRVKPSSGRIFFEDEVINGLNPHTVVKKGIVCVPEGREIFVALSVQDNLEMGAYSKKYSARQFRERYDEVYEMFPILYERRRQLAGSLSGGQQQMLALGRGLMSSPRVMLLDEPSLGLAPIIVQEVFDFIVSLNKEKGISILLVEQNAFMALDVSSRCYVFENGTIAISGASSEMAENPSVKTAYLGG